VRIGLLGLLAVAAMAAGPEEDALRRMQESRAEINAYLLRCARGGALRALEEIRTREAWEKVRERRREEMREMLGLLPWPARTPLLAQVTGTIAQGSYRVEKVTFQSLPKVYVSANLYLPAGGGRHPAVVYACGHLGSPGGAKVTYQRHGISLAKNGYVAIVLDPIQEAEAFSFHHGVRFDEQYDWYSRGYTAGGVEAWNAIRAIDYLETRPEVDKTRIGMTGFSGGAMATYYTAAIEPRIKVAAPFMGLATYASILQQDSMRRHCDCMFPVNLHAHDMLHLAALIAPRPLLMGQGVKDTLFPEEGYKECARGLDGLYRSYQRPEAFRWLLNPPPAMKTPRRTARP
jgi:dienelactone hydrolase